MERRETYIRKAKYSTDTLLKKWSKSTCGSLNCAFPLRSVTWNLRMWPSLEQGSLQMLLRYRSEDGFCLDFRCPLNRTTGVVRTRESQREMTHRYRSRRAMWRQWQRWDSHKPKHTWGQPEPKGVRKFFLEPPAGMVPASNLTSASGP